MTEDKKYIQIVQGVGETLGVGSVPVGQLPVIAGSFGVILMLNLFLHWGLFTCFLLGSWTAATGWLVTGDSPHRFLNRLLSRNHEWVRGFEPSRSLLEQQSNDEEE